MLPVKCATQISNPKIQAETSGASRPSIHKAYRIIDQTGNKLRLRPVPQAHVSQAAHVEYPAIASAAGIKRGRYGPDYSESPSLDDSVTSDGPSVSELTNLRLRRFLNQLNMSARDTDTEAAIKRLREAVQQPASQAFAFHKEAKMILDGAIRAGYSHSASELDAKLAPILDRIKPRRLSASEQNLVSSAMPRESAASISSGQAARAALIIMNSEKVSVPPATFSGPAFSTATVLHSGMQSAPAATETQTVASLTLDRLLYDATPPELLRYNGIVYQFKDYRDVGGKQALAYYVICSPDRVSTPMTSVSSGGGPIYHLAPR